MYGVSFPLHGYALLIGRSFLGAIAFLGSLYFLGISEDDIELI
jgi:hypothetical protein